MTADAFDTRRYGRLLAKFQPRAIETEEENERALGVVEGLFEKADRRTPEEDALTALLVALIERFEDEHYALTPSTPLERLKILMEEHGLKQKDLADLFGSPGVTSEVLSGKRSISKTAAKRLGERFRLSPALFLVDDSDRAELRPEVDAPRELPDSRAAEALAAAGKAPAAKDSPGVSPPSGATPLLATGVTKRAKRNDPAAKHRRAGRR